MLLNIVLKRYIIIYDKCNDIAVLKFETLHHDGLIILTTACEFKVGSCPLYKLYMHVNCSNI